MDKGYYAIIPASVRYDERLTPNAKLLYGEITALCNAKGYCWATNNYFAELYKVSKVSISKWIGSLKEAGYISIYFEQDKSSRQVSHRYISIIYDPLKENFNPPQRILCDPHKEKFKDNNTVNTTVNTTNNIDHFDSFWSVYPRKVGKAQARKAWDKLKPSDDIIKDIAENIALRMKHGEWSDVNKTFIPHAATYLNNARWEDEVEPSSKVAKKPNQIKKRDIEDALTDRSWAN